MSESTLSLREKQYKANLAYKSKHPTFPLTAHSSGRWAKQVRGRRVYLSTEPNEALAEWHRFKDEFAKGYDPRLETGCSDTFGWLADQFLQYKHARYKAGELTLRTFNDYKKEAQAIVDYFGKERTVDTFGPDAFTAFKESMERKGTARSLQTKLIRTTRTLFKWAADNEKVSRMPAFGSAFKLPSKKQQRLARPAKKRLLDAATIHALLAKAGPQMKAMILLGINCGYGNKDCGRLERRWIDWDAEWLSEPRGKTGVERDAWLWPETLDALKAVEAMRPNPTERKHQSLVFVTAYGNPFAGEVKYKHRVTGEVMVRETSEVGPAFDKLKKAAKVDGAFYDLRRTFQTIAGASLDPEAVSHVMGHIDGSMAGVYRQGVDKERIRKVCGVVRDWLFGSTKSDPKLLASGGIDQ